MNEIKKVYFTSREVAEALGCSREWVFQLARKLNLIYRGNKRKRKFTDYDLMKLKNQTLNEQRKNTHRKE